MDRYISISKIKVDFFLSIIFFKLILLYFLGFYGRSLYSSSNLFGLRPKFL